MNNLFQCLVANVYHLQEHVRDYARENEESTVGAAMQADRMDEDEGDAHQGLWTLANVAELEDEITVTDDEMEVEVEGS